MSSKNISSHPTWQGAAATVNIEVAVMAKIDGDPNNIIRTRIRLTAPLAIATIEPSLVEAFKLSSAVNTRNVSNVLAAYLRFSDP